MQRDDLTQELFSAAIAGGNLHAERALIDALSPVLRARVRRVCARLDRRSEVEDVVQQVWLRLFSEERKVLRSFDPQKGAAVAYFGKIAQRAALDYFSRKSRVALTADGSLEAPEIQASPETRMIARDQLEKVAINVGTRRSPRLGQVLEMYFLENQTPDAIAAMLKTTNQVIHNSIFKIRSAARLVA